MIKVLNILTDSNIGGAGRCLINYLKYMDRSAFQVSVVLPQGSLLVPEVEALGVPVLQCGGIADKSYSREAVRALKQIIRREQPDIVHTHGSLSGRIAARQAGTRVVFTRHSAFPVPAYLKKGPGHWLNGRINSHYADQIIAVSPATAQNLLDSGVPEKKITVMMNGVEPLTPSTPQDQAALRQQLGISEDLFTAGILARLEPYKGHRLLLEAARELKDQGRDFRILIGGSGSAEADILAGIREMGLEDRVLFLGFVTDVAGVLSILDVQLNCSYGTEASSIALIEGMSLGLATVASNYGGNPWQVEDGVSGLLFENLNSHDLAEKLARLMDDPALLAALRRGAKGAYETKFTGKIFAGNIEAVYKKTMDGKGGTL